MNGVNRTFVCVLALAWSAALAGVLVLVWDDTRSVSLSGDNLRLLFDVSASTRAEQILATILAAALVLPALILLGLELKPQRRSERDEARRALQARVDALEKELETERRRPVAAPSVAAPSAVARGDGRPRNEPARRRWWVLPGAHN